MAAAPKKGRLGKGLSALLGEYAPAHDAAESGTDSLRQLSTARIAPNPFQPRREFAPEQLAELEESIRQNGLLQPIVVRAATGATPEGADWELVAGERRWRAVRRLGWTEVPAVVKELDDRAMLILAIVENVQRAELSPLEEAQGYRQLVDEFGFTQAEVAESVGRDRSTVANLLRLLQLPASVQRLVSQGALSMGHARAILGLEDEREMADLAREAAEKNLSVRNVEERVRTRRSAPPSSTADASAGAGAPALASAGKRGLDDPHLRHLEGELQRTLGTAARIHVKGAGKAGRIEIPFYNADDFDRVLDLILGSEADRA
ncbi:MAG TPA: ParB/RepB/Spo0J family partition protein [Longimicrobiaceae bacterium]|nr:ParB/RepB/Spo0J family partition protein [Longimicrobiaceae bacterium]